MLNMTFGGVMFRLLMPSGEDEVLGHAILALVLQLRPHWEVEREATGPQGNDTVRIRDDATGRWIAVAGQEDLANEAAEAVADGACSVISLASRIEDLEEALKTLIDGQRTYISPAVAVSLAREAAGHAHKDRANVRLTPRELEVLQCVARGMSNKEIALELGVSVNTVRTHLHSLASKLDATGRASLAAVAWQTGLVKSE